MIKAAWRLLLNSITTTILLMLIGVPILDTIAILGVYGVLLCLQEKIIIAITERKDKHDRNNKGRLPHNNRSRQTGAGTHRKAV